MPITVNDITQAYVKNMLHYDPETGIFTWTNCLRSDFNGKEAGHIKSHSTIDYPHRVIHISGVSVHASRLAWLYMTGEWPVNVIDHINRNQMDNSWDNLRDISVADNNRNLAIFKDNTTGYNGIRLIRGMYNVRVRRDEILYNIGHYKTLDEALNARLTWIHHYDDLGEILDLRPKYELEITSKTGHYGIYEKPKGKYMYYRIDVRFEGVKFDLGLKKSVEEAIIVRDKFLNDRKAGIIKPLEEYKTARKKPKTGHSGITKSPYGTYCVSFSRNCQKIYLGYFDTLEEAVEAKRKWLEDNT